MKKILTFVLPAVLAIIAVACSFAPAGTGSLTLNLPEEFVANARLMSTGTTANILRIYLVQNGTFVALQPAAAGSPHDIPITGTTVELSDLLPGSNYQLYVAYGGYYSDKTTGFKVFEADQYASSPTFSISAGVNTAVSIQLLISPFSRVAAGGHASVAVVGSVMYVYVQTDNTISASTGTTINLTTALPGYKVNSLSVGKWWASSAQDKTVNAFNEELWINTDKGIVPFRNSTLVTGFMSGLANLPNETASGTFVVNMAKTGDPADYWLFAYYSGSGFNIGFASSDNAADVASNGFEWQAVSAYVKDPANSSTFGSLQTVIDAIEKGGNLINSFAITENYGYVAFGASPLGTYRFGQDLADKLSGLDFPDNPGPEWFLSNILNKSEYQIGLASPAGSITAIASVPTTSETAYDGILYVATDKGGVYSVAVNKDGLMQTGHALSLISGTSGKYFTKIVAKAGRNNVAYAAAVTKKGTVMVFKNNQVLTQYPFYAGMYANTQADVGNVLLVDASASVSGLALIVTGSNGAVLTYIEGVNPQT